MIKKKLMPTFQTTDEKLWIEVEAARRHQIGIDFDKILNDSANSPGRGGNWSAQSVRQFLMDNVDQFHFAFQQLAVYDDGSNGE